MSDEPAQYCISNYTASPRGKWSYLDMVQRLMFLGSWDAADSHVYEGTGWTTDTHSMFSFITFEKDDYTTPVLPDID